MSDGITRGPIPSPGDQIPQFPQDPFDEFGPLIPPPNIEGAKISQLQSQVDASEMLPTGQISVHAQEEILDPNLPILPAANQRALAQFIAVMQNMTGQIASGSSSDAAKLESTPSSGTTPRNTAVLSDFKLFTDASGNPILPNVNSTGRIVINPAMVSNAVAILTVILNQVAAILNKIVEQSSTLKQAMMGLTREYANALYDIAIEIGEKEAKMHELNAAAALGSVAGAILNIGFQGVALGFNLNAKTDHATGRINKAGTIGMFAGQVGPSVGQIVSETTKAVTEFLQADTTREKAELQATQDFLKQIMEAIRQTMDSASQEGSAASQHLQSLIQSYADWNKGMTQRVSG